MTSYMSYMQNKRKGILEELSQTIRNLENIHSCRATRKGIQNQVFGIFIMQPEKKKQNVKSTIRKPQQQNEQLVWNELKIEATKYD